MKKRFAIWASAMLVGFLMVGGASAWSQHLDNMAATRVSADHCLTQSAAAANCPYAHNATANSNAYMKCPYLRSVCKPNQKRNAENTVAVKLQK